MSKKRKIVKDAQGHQEGNEVPLRSVMSATAPAGPPNLIEHKCKICGKDFRISNEWLRDYVVEGKCPVCIREEAKAAAREEIIDEEPIIQARPKPVLNGMVVHMPNDCIGPELSQRLGWHYHYDGRSVPEGSEGMAPLRHVAQKEPECEVGIACDDFWELWQYCDSYDKQRGTHEERIERLRKKYGTE